MQVQHIWTDESMKDIQKWNSNDKPQDEDKCSLEGSCWSGWHGLSIVECLAWMAGRGVTEHIFVTCWGTEQEWQMHYIRIFNLPLQMYKRSMCSVQTLFQWNWDFVFNIKTVWFANDVQPIFYWKHYKDKTCTVQTDHCIVFSKWSVTLNFMAAQCFEKAGPGSFLPL